jgi:hypothetical protein
VKRKWYHKPRRPSLWHYPQLRPATSLPQHRDKVEVLRPSISAVRLDVPEAVPTQIAQETEIGILKQAR